MDNTGTKSGKQDSNFGGSRMGDSPALAALKATAPNPNSVPTQNSNRQTSARTQVKPNDLFSRMETALEPGLFDADIPLQDVPSSNNPADYQVPPQQINQPPQRMVTQQEQLAEVLGMNKQPLPNEVNVQTQQQPQQFADPNLQGQPDKSVEQRYSDSSREAKRLALENANLKKQVDSIAPVMPLIMKLKESESLRNIVNGYYSDGGIMPKDIKKTLNLSDDFVFDGDDAFNKPDSESAKVLASTIDMASFARANQVREEIMQTLAKQRHQENAERERQLFKQSNSLSDDQMSNLDNFMKTHTVTLDDILYLSSRGLREQNIAQNVQQDVISQMHNVREIMPQTLSGASPVPVDMNSEDALFQNAFGNAQNEKGFFD